MSGPRGDLKCMAVPEKLLSIRELSQCLGVQVKTVYGWIHMRYIPYIKVGRLVKFDPQDILQWVEDRKVGINGN